MRVLSLYAVLVADMVCIKYSTIGDGHFTFLVFFGPYYLLEGYLLTSHQRGMLGVLDGTFDCSPTPSDVFGPITRPETGQRYTIWNSKKAEQGNVVSNFSVIR